MEGENPVYDQESATMWYVLEESVCLGMQTKMGGKYHLKLNIGERPIANKYREGKMKRTLKRELKVREIVNRETFGTSVASSNQSLLRQRCTCCEQVNISFRRSKKLWRGSCSQIEVMLCGGLANSVQAGCWRNGFKRPVLKHGPRSLTNMRVFGRQTLMRNESEIWWELYCAPSTGLDFFDW